MNGPEPGAGPAPLRVVVVDDEPLARAVLRELLAEHEGVAIVAECGNGFEAVSHRAGMR